MSNKQAIVAGLVGKFKVTDMEPNPELPKLTKDAAQQIMQDALVAAGYQHALVAEIG
jgi:hypothetical protein